MLEGLKGLMASEKGLAGGILIVAATVLVVIGKMSVQDWQTFSTMIFGTYVAGKTIQGSVSILKNGVGKMKK